MVLFAHNHYQRTIYCIVHPSYTEAMSSIGTQQDYFFFGLAPLIKFSISTIIRIEKKYKLYNLNIIIPVTINSIVL